MGLQPLDLKEFLSRPVGGAKAEDSAAKSLGRAGPCPAHWLGPSVDSECHSSLPFNHRVCMPCWDTPFRMALGKKVGSPAHHPFSLTSLLSAPSQLHPGNRTIKETPSKPPTEGALGRPDSRSAIVHFLLGRGPFRGPLWPPPSYSLSPAHPSFPLHPPPGSGQPEHWETGWLTSAWLFTSASKPTTHSCSREDESSHCNRQTWLRS